MSPDDSLKRFQFSFLTVVIDFHETVLSSPGSDISQYPNLFVSELYNLPAIGSDAAQWQEVCTGGQFGHGRWR